MKTIKLEDNLFVYQFEPFVKKFIGQNIIVIKSNQEYLIIDTGYSVHMKAVLEVIDKSKIKTVIATHFHPDHIFGILELSKVKLIGSRHYLDTIKKFEIEDEIKYHPDILVGESYEFDFGKNHLKIILNQGHSNCGTLITLNDKYLFVGDDLMYTNESLSVLPYLAENNPSLQITALRQILVHAKGKTVIPSHGAIIRDYEFLKNDINNKITYLNWIQTNKKTLADFTKETNISFIGELWHQNNIL